MSQLRQVELRRESIGALRDIVSSMRSLAGAYLQRAQAALESVRAYEKMVDAGISLALGPVASSFEQIDPWSRPCLLVFTSDQGLCGPFVEALGKAAIQGIKERGIQEKARLLVVGQQGVSIFKRMGLQGELISAAPNSLEGAMSCIPPLTETISDLYERGEVSSVQLLYNVFEGVGRFSSRWRQLLPPDIEALRNIEEGSLDEPLAHIPFYDMLGVLLEELLFIGLHRAMVESMASENGSRMRAMDAATHNCEDMLEDLTRIYMQLRQEEITGELLDVASGAEALRESG